MHGQFKIDGIEAGMDEMIVKPCYIGVLIEVLKRSNVIDQNIEDL